MPSLLPEIREGDAPPEIKLIYADMRRCLRLPLVNLIYRYFATVPGVLPHVWGWVREMMLSGNLEASLARLNRNLPVPPIEPFEPASLKESDWDSIKRVLATYNRGNGLNLIALTAVKLDLQRRARPPLEITEVPTSGGIPTLPPLLKFSELPPDIAEGVMAITNLHEGIDGVIPSLYLHLANWPEFLAAAASRIMPLLKDGSVERSRRAAVELAGSEARALIAPMQNVAGVTGFSDRVIATLDQFTTRVIPDMLPIGLMLDRACPPADDKSLR